MNLYCLSCFYINDLSLILHQIFNEYELSALLLHYSPSNFQWIDTVSLAFTSVICLLFPSKFSMNLYCLSCFYISDLSVILLQILNEFILSVFLLHQWSVCYSPPNFIWFYTVCLAFTSVICLLFSTKFYMILYCLPSFNISDPSVIPHQIFNGFILFALLLHQWSVYYSPPNFQWIYTVCLAFTSVICLLFSTIFSMNIYCLPCFYIIFHQIFNGFILSALLLHQWSVYYSPPNFQWIYTVCLAFTLVICLLFFIKFSMNLYCLLCFYINDLSVILHQIFNEYVLSALLLHYSPSKFSMNLYCLPCFYISDLSIIFHQICNEFILSALLLHQWSFCYSPSNFQWIYTVCLASTSMICYHSNYGIIEWCT